MYNKVKKLKELLLINKYNFHIIYEYVDLLVRFKGILYCHIRQNRGNKRRNRTWT
jgi:hypothetical protein